MNLNFAWASKAARGALAFSKKNLPSIMVGASIAGFWAAIIFIAKDAPKAKEEIESKGEDLKLKDKTIIYVKHCWRGMVTGLAATGLGIGAQGINIERLAGAYMLAQMYKDDGEKLKKQILKEEDGPKKLENLKKAVLEEDFPDDVVDSYIQTAPGNGNTLFIDTVTGAKWMGDIVDVMSGINEANELLRDEYNKAYKRVYKGAFSASEGPHYDEYNPEVYGTLALDEFLAMLGMDTEVGYESIKLGGLLEFRLFSDSNILKPSQILDYKKYKDASGNPKVCFIRNYDELLSPTSELLERYP